MKKIFALFVLIPIFACGCSQSYQIDELVFAKILGIDYNDGKVTVTVGIKESEKNDGEETSVSVEADTVAQGVNKLSQSSQKRVFLGQVSVILLGEEYAQNGITPAVDYFIRAAEMRFDLPVLITKGKTAKEAIEESERRSPLDEKIENLLKYAYTVSSSGTVKLSRLVEMNEDKFEAVYLPYLTFGEGVFLSGYAVFSQDRLWDCFTEEESRGINFIADTFGDWVFPVKISDDVFTVMVSDSKTDICLEEGVFNIKIKFKTTVLQSENGRTDIENGEIEEILNAEKEIAKNTVVTAVDKLKSIPADAGGCFGLTYYRKSGKNAYENVENWQETFGKIKYTVSVEAETDTSKTQQAHVKGN